MGKGQGKTLTLNSAFRVGFTGTLGVGLAIGLIAALQSVATVFIYIGLALFLALGLEPIVLWLVERKLPRSLAVVLVVLAFIGIVAGAVL
ncbi:MAG: AI-2E family transporter, partial [Brevibacterium aurantiacum]